MDLELTDVQQELASTLGRLLATKYDAVARDEVLASEAGYSESMWQQFAEIGLLGLPFDEAYDGAGMGFAEVAVVMEQFGRALTLEPYLPTVVLGGGLVAAVGTDEQKQDILPAVAAGERKLAFAGYEPTSRYDLTAPATTASVTADGTTLTGEKSGVLGGASADQLIVSAAVDGGVGLFLVDPQADGVSVDERRQADGHRSASVLLDAAPAVRLGSGDAGEAIAAVIDTANAALCAEAVGAMEAALKMTAQYLHTREQFGAPIGRNQVLQHRAADLYATLEYAKSMALYAKLAVSDGEAKDRHRDVVAAKVVVDDACRHVSQEAIQMHGGIGMTMEYPIGHYAKRLTVIPRTFDEADSLIAELAELGGLIEPYAADLAEA